MALDIMDMATEAIYTLARQRAVCVGMIPRSKLGHCNLFGGYGGFGGFGCFMFMGLGPVKQIGYAWQGTTLSRTTCRSLLSAVILMPLRDVTRSRPSRQRTRETKKV